MEFDFGGGYQLRGARGEDHSALKLVALRTGDAGRDASGREDDPGLLGLIYAVPYQVFSPEFAFVVEGPGGVCGYVLGTPDSAAFYEWMGREWFPKIAAGVADPGPDEARWRGSDWARWMIHHPAFVYPEALKPYPAHGHIDLLPEVRGRGIGRRGLELVMGRLAAAGAPGMHLQVSPRNGNARHFYERLGFARLKAEGLPRHTVFMVRELTPGVGGAAA